MQVLMADIAYLGVFCDCSVFVIPDMATTKAQPYSEPMTILNFITHEELDNLDDDPRVAFMELVNYAQRRLSEQTDKLDPTDQLESIRLDEINHSFMNVIVAAAKRLEIEPFTAMDVPDYRNFGINHHRDFRANLDHYVTQLMLDNRIRAKRDSVTILPVSKDRIRAHLNGLRQCIEQANMTDAKREALLFRLDEFERELEKRRLNIMAVALLTCQVLAIPGGVWASAEIVQKLTTNIMQTVAEARAAEEETRKLAPTAPFKALSPPRKENSRRASTKPNYDLDDDIPF